MSDTRTLIISIRVIIVTLLTMTSSCQEKDDPDIPTLIEQSKSSVVRIVVVEAGLYKKPLPHVVGTGFVVATGKVATAAHVVKGLPEGSIFLVSANQEKFDLKQNSAKVIAYEPKHDIALLECSALKNVPSLQLHQASKVRIGEEVLVMGFPLSDPTLTATKAIVAAKSKRKVLENDPNLTEMFKLDASINMGNSGGPVIHVISGKVIGIVCAKEGSISKQLQVFKQKKAGATMTIGGDDPVQLIKETLSDMERNLQLGLGYSVSVEYLGVLLGQVEKQSEKEKRKK